MKKVRAEEKKPGFRWTVERLKIACKYKRRPGDKKMPTLRDDLLARYQETKNRASPQVSPANSDDEADSEDEDGGDDVSLGEDESEDDEASLGEEEGDEEEDGPSGGLEFGSDDDESSESEEEEYSDDE